MGQIYLSRRIILACDIFRLYFVSKDRLPPSGLQGLPQAQQKQVLTKASGPQ